VKRSTRTSKKAAGGTKKHSDVEPSADESVDEFIEIPKVSHSRRPGQLLASFETNLLDREMPLVLLQKLQARTQIVPQMKKKATIWSK
jgi:hypothetical protein